MNVLVTGASRGIGFELVKQYAVKKDNKIVALSRDAELLQELKVYCEAHFQNSIHVHAIDFSSLKLREELNLIFAEHAHHFDVVVNNAGCLMNEPFLNYSNVDIQKVFQVNVFAPIQVIQSVIPLLDANAQCHFINIGSMGGFQGSSKFPGLSIYSSSKAALANLTECLAEEHKESNIKFNCLALGSVQTEMLNEAFPGYKAQTTPEEMARYIAEFSIMDPLFFNGKVLPVSISTP